MRFHVQVAMKLSISISFKCTCLTNLESCSAAAATDSQGKWRDLVPIHDEQSRHGVGFRDSI